MDSDQTPPRRMPATVSELTLLTLNIHMGFAPFNRRFMLPELKAAVHAVHADVVFLQETLGSHAGHALRQAGWPAEAQSEFIADTLWGNVAYGRNAVYADGHHGNAVLSKFPILRWDNHDISIVGTEPRGFLHCVLAVPQAGNQPPLEVHAICTHLGLREAHRRQQLERLCAFIAELPPDAPLIVAGDFNDWRQRAGPLLAAAGLVDAFVAAGQLSPRSYPARMPLLRLDRIYVRQVTVAAAQVLSTPPWKHLSDHAALTATLQP
ncbi:MAG: endonuclease/exonuclease/phosphatase family protein [Nevskia sp.]|nr:endonuclease/exonuclease/phosphatase family protein [Nevskia sp.]